MKKRMSYVSLAVIGVLVVLGLISDRVKDRVLRAMISRSVEQASGLQASLEGFRYNVFRTEFELLGFTLRNPESFGDSDAIRIDRLYIDANLRSLFSDEMHIKLCELDIGHINIIEHADTKSNFAVIADLFDEALDAADTPTDLLAVGQGDDVDRPIGETERPVAESKLSSWKRDFKIDHLRITLNEVRLEMSTAPGRRPIEMTARMEVDLEYKNVRDLDEILDEILVEIMAAAGPRILLELMSSPNL